MSEPSAAAPAPAGEQQPAQQQAAAAAKKKVVPPPLPAEPAYWAPRLEMFNRLHDKYAAWLAARIQEATPLSLVITLPTPAKDKKPVTCVAYKDTPFSALIAAGCDEAVAHGCVVAKFSAEAGHDASPVEWDMSRPLEPCLAGKTMECFGFDSDAGRHVFWHSSAHIMGQAMERKYGGLLNVGPPTEQDFYYDIRTPEGVIIAAGDFGEIEKLCEKYSKEAQAFQRLEVTREEAKELFGYNKYKMAILERTPADEKVTAYRCGNLVDMCRGPHLPNTRMAKAWSITSSSSVYLDGNATSDQLQRLHGLSFPDKKQLKEWQTLLDEAQKRDHRKIGQDQELFFFHPVSPGSAFFLPRGYRIYQKLIDFMRGEYEKRGYSEVLAPNIFQSKLWEISGHWQHYRENMFTFTVEDQPFALKPMNCPGHCVMFAHRVRSYRELPIRFAEFGVLHRNELSGALHGLTRVRRFQQDDSHIFCRMDQIQQEVAGVLDLIKYTYGIFGFDFKLELSTRPEHFLGDISIWNKAEEGLKQSLDKLGLPWVLNPGDGAFYGPKIDVHIRDALHRYHQCGTVQLDFQLPIRFDLQYMAEGSSAPAVEGQAQPQAKWERPVMVHRAVFGSIERFMAILLEHLGGKLPFWISPRQAMVVPVNIEKHLEYANKVSALLREQHYYVDVDDSDKTLQKKVREAQLAQYNYILVVGQEEAESNSVNVRLREGNQVLGKMTIAELLDRFSQFTRDHK